jgi:glyoxylase-like metal-dependent hydrolase (beta-lactamase superfamily II)
MAEVYSDVFEAFSGFDRFDFPEGIVRVTAGHGGESLLLTGSEKTALLDCGMAYCADKLIENIKRQLGGRNLDYVLLSHTHYDHIGALPFIKQVWPDVITFGAEHAGKVFSKQGAIHTINALSESVCKIYGRNAYATAVHNQGSCRQAAALYFR